VEIAVRANAKLAEGPRWDAATRRLLWVDIEGCELHVLESGKDRAIRLDAMVGAAAPTTGGSGLVALADRLALVGLADESVRTLVTLPHGPALRSNDRACDAAGRFWIGTMALDLTPGAGALYRYDGSGSCVHCYDERGRLDAVLEVPAENVTSCCFGGADGRSLFVTAAAPNGNVYVTQPGVSGPPAHVFHVGATRTAPSDAEDTSAR